MIAYLGPAGSYSYLAALKCFSLKESELISKPDFEDVLNYVLENSGNKAVIPIENSIEGSVNNCLDLLTELNLFIEKESVLKIEHCLIAKDGVKAEDVENVLSHSQAYNQCKKNIKKLLPNAKILFTLSTSDAVQKLDLKSVAIAGEQNLKDGLSLFKKGIQDVENNSTRFLLMGGEYSFDKNASKVSIIFEAPDKPGGLLNLLNILYTYGLNMKKIESRPHKSALGRYIFFVDFMGNLNDENTKKALEEIKRNTVFFKLLGNY